MSQLDDLSAAGFSPQEVNAYGAQQRQTLSSAGFSDQEVNDYLGAPAQPQPNMGAANHTFAGVLGGALASIKNAAQNIDKIGGQGESAMHTVEDIGSGYAPVEAALNAGTGLLFGFPAYIGGAIGGLAGKYLLNNGADPQALADTMQKIATYQPVTARGQRLAGNLMEPLSLLQKGSEAGGHEVTDVANRMGASTNVAAGAGAITSATLQMLPVPLLGELARKMGGQVITNDDMQNAAKLAAGPEATPETVSSVEGSLRATYEKTGIGPYTVLEEAQKSPELAAQLADSATQVPPALEQYVEKPPAAAEPTPGDGAPLMGDLSGMEVSEQPMGDEFSNQEQTGPRPTDQDMDRLSTLAGGESAPGWASETKIIGPDEQPATVYRGAQTALEPDHFSEEAIGQATAHPSSGLGVWFSTSPEDAAGYGNTEGFHLDIRNPMVISADKLPGFDSTAQASAYRAKLQSEGYDGLVVDASNVGGQKHIVAFSPKQVIRTEPSESMQAPEQPPAVQHQIVGGMQTQELPVSGLSLSKDVPQFKSDANAKGVVEPLGGKYDRTGVASVQVWKRLDGRMEVISGRHRLDLAQRTGEDTIPAQVHDEANGFDVTKAARLDAELNIRDGQGKVKDYVNFFKDSGLSKEDAEQRGLLARSTGKRAWTIANEGSDELIAAHRNGAVSDDSAVAIASAAPGDARLQSVGIKAVEEGKTGAQAVNLVKAVKVLSAPESGANTGDMFGFDESGMREAQDMARIATAAQRDITTRLSAIRGAAKRPELAAAEGIDVKDSAGILQRVDALNAERAAWDNWSTNPELVDKIRQQLHPDGDVTPVNAEESESFLSAQTPEELQAKTEREANAPALDQKAQIDAEAEHFQLQGETQEKPDTTGNLFGTGSDTAMLHAGVDVAQAVRNIRDSYTPYVGVVHPEIEVKPAGLGEGTSKSPMLDSLQKIFAPAARGDIAAKQAGIMRANFGEMAHEREVALEKMKGIAAEFDHLPVAENLKFIDAMERGTKLTDAKQSRAATALRTLLDTKRDEVQELGKGQLENFDENYFPHIWKDADENAMQSMYSRRPLEGSKGFLKSRTVPFTTDGMRWRAYDAQDNFIKSFDSEEMAKNAAGPDGRVGKPLTPVTTNPVEMALLKAREMDKYIYGQKIFGEMKDADLARFVRFGARALPGWTKINDKIARVFLPSDIPIHEAYDEQMMGKLMKFAHDIGVSPERLNKIGGSRWGYASRMGDVVTKFGGPETVLTHELGHQLDFKYGLKDQFVNNPGTKKELRSLADLRYEGHPETTEGYKKYVRKGEEKMANMVHAFTHMPDRMKQVAPNTYAKFSQFLDDHPELAGLRDVKPSLTLGTDSDTVNAGGAVIAGEFYAPDEAATLINNHLSPGLQGNAFFDAWRGIGMAMNSLQLGLSAFHVGFTTMDSMISKVALGIKQMSRGDILEGGGNVVQGLNPAQTFMNIYKGDRLLRAYLGKLDNPDLLPIVDAIQQAGGRVKMDDFYRNTQVNAFKQALRSADYLGAAKSFLPTVLDRVSAPIFEELVPRQKLGVFSDMAKDWLAKNPDADLDAKRAGLGKLWDSVDNRMGQLVYDNVFWNHALKDGLMATVRSVGWNLGTFRELGGGLLDVKDIAANKGFSDRTAYVVALPLLTAIYGATLGYAYTGQMPQSLKDCFYPKTGATRPDGSEDRVSLPTYMKDVYGYGEDAHNFVAYGGDPTQTLKNKMHPLIATVSQMLNNQDFFGGAIRNPADPAMKQIMDEVGYIIQQTEPFSLRNYFQQAQAKGETPSMQGYLTSPSMIGITPAPGYVTKSAAELESSQVSRLHAPLVEKYKEAIKGGADPQSLIPAMMNSGLTKRDIRYIISASSNTPKPHKLKSFGTEEPAN